MKTIGMIVAVEIQSVLKRYGAKLVKRKETMDAAADLCLEVVEKIVAGMEISKR